MRKLAAWFATLILLIPAVAVAAPDWFTILDQRVTELETRVDALEAQHSTTTTTTSTTTTTEPTTTTVPLTTTTTLSSTELAETLDYHAPNGLQDDEGFLFMLSCLDTETVTCDRDANGKTGIADFAYMGHGMPYLYENAVEGNHDHAWWVPGDREAYRCAYAFMYDRHPNPFGELTEPREGRFIARATIVRPQGQSYGKINDKYMEEGKRYYDGTFVGGSKELPDEDCQQSALDDFDYDSYVPQGPDEIRVGLLTTDGQVGDIRDFTNKTFPGHFEFLGFDGQRVTVLLILDAADAVSHVFYYDVMGDGRIVVEVNGQLIGG